MNSRHREICFTTLAIGSKYRKHALALAKDIQSLAPDIPFIVLTDQPDDFSRSDTLIPVKHRVQSVGMYHDKLDCMAESFRQGFDDCLFLDADCRLLKNASISRQWKIGLTAQSCYDLKKHILRRETSEKGLYRLIEGIARSHDISIEQCKFINEWVFAVCTDGNEDVFIQAWKEIRNILERKRIFAGEGVAIGMATKIAGWSVYHYDTGYPEEAERHRIIDIYKDKMFFKKNSIPDNFQEKFQDLESERKAIEEQDPITRKINKVKNLVDREIRYLRLKLKNPVLNS